MRRLVTFLTAPVVLVLAGTASAGEPEWPWRYDHWPQQQPWHVSQGELSYTIAIRSLDGAGPQRRGVRLLPAVGQPTGDGWARCRFPLHNSGRAATAGTHPEDVSAYLRSDVYRMSAEARTRGWTVWVPNQLAATRFGSTDLVTVYAKRESGSHVGRITLTATSESDASKDDAATCLAVAR